MSRHAKNNTASAVFTHYERSKLKYGTQKQRLGRDSVKHFDACSLCLQPVVNPLCCLKGHLFCKVCIYESLLSQKKEIKKQKKLYDSQEQQLKEQQLLEKEKRREAELAAFDKSESGILPETHQIFKPLPADHEHKHSTITATTVATTTTPVSLVPYENDEQSIVVRVEQTQQEVKPVAQAKEGEEVFSKKLNAFWVPSLTPSAAPTLLVKPSSETRCIEGNHPLKLKQLIPVNFSPLANIESTDPNHVLNERYCCPVCRKTLTDSPKAVVLKTCGHVHCLGCSQKFKSEKICTVCDTPYKETDVIRLQSGGTGFSGHDDNLEAKKITPAAWV